ncbi:regulator of sigma D [Escherichia coli]|uniref:Regulator of sigma D n=1 Tax=Escherichia coli TaxID=562 RepID=A0A376W9X4_ECOLX|nr:regulator of sigma D [Escherichia coli]
MLNQLDNLTERVRGSNKLVDRWLHVRKHLLVAYYNLVGIKPGKESYMRLNEKALDDFCQSLVDYLSAGHFSIYERILHKLEGNGQLARAAKIWPQLEANTQQIMDDYDLVWKPPSIMIITLSFNRFYLTSARHWKRALCWKIS